MISKLLKVHIEKLNYKHVHVYIQIKITCRDSKINIEFHDSKSAHPNIELWIQKWNDEYRRINHFWNFGYRK